MSFLLSTEAIVPEVPSFHEEEGAEVQFLGTVRGLEDGKPIRGIDYSAYDSMAGKMLAALLERGRAEHGGHRVFIQHRLGFVEAETPSILIRVHAKHSSEAFSICEWYLREVKTTVPIWKRPVWVESRDGETAARRTNPTPG